MKEYKGKIQFKFDRQARLKICLSIIIVVGVMFLWTGFAQAKYLDSISRNLSLSAGGDTPSSITYNPNDINSGIAGRFSSGKTEPQVLNQDMNRLFNVPITEDNHVDNPVPDNADYKFEYWYTLKDGKEVVYKNLNSTICSESNWPVGNTFYAKFSPKLAITYDSTSGHYSDGSTKKVIEQTIGQTFKKPEVNPIWEVEGSSDNPEFAYWYEIDESGQHIKWTDEMFARSVSEDLMPRNNILYAEWDSTDFIVEFDAREELGGHFEDGDFIKLVPQTLGNTFNLPDNPINSKGTFVHWNLNKYVDDESTRIDSSSQVKAEYNHIRVYAHYTYNMHRVTVMVANPESGGKITWKNDFGETVTDTQTYYDAPDLIDGKKLFYSLTSSIVDNKLVGYADFSRNGVTSRVFSSSNDEMIVFSRFAIEETQTGRFPGWEGNVNTDITIKLFFSSAGDGAYWVYNNGADDIYLFDSNDTADNPCAPAYTLTYFYDGHYDDWKNRKSSKSKLVVCSALITTSGANWNYSSSGMSTLKTSVRVIDIDPTFKNFPITNTSQMFQGFSYASVQFTDRAIGNITMFGVTNMYYMFGAFRNMPSADLSQWDTRSVINMEMLFNDCSNRMTWLNLSNWNPKNCTNFKKMFYGCSNLLHIYVNDNSVNWKIDGQTQTCTNMFQNTKSLHNIVGSSTTSFGISNCYCDNVDHPSTSAGLFETWKGL